MTSGLVGACGEDPQPPTQPTAQAVEKPDPARLRKVHTEALQRAIPEAQKAFAMVDPIAAWELGDGDLRPVPHAPVSFSQVLVQQQAASKEVDEIKADFLSQPGVVQLRALGLGLRRIVESAGGRALTRNDPTQGVFEAHRFLDAVDRARASGKTQGLAEAIAALEVGMRVYYKDLGAASPETLAAALEDFEPLAARVRSLGARDVALGASADALGKTLAEIRTALKAQREALPGSADVEWDQWPRPANGQPSLHRLPGVLGADALKRRLKIEEGLDRNYVEAVPQLLGLAGRLDNVEARYPAIRTFEEGPATPVSEARCKPVVDRLREKIVGEGAAPPELDCAWLLTLWGERSLSDAALVVAVIDDGWVAPRARAQRSAAPPWAALQSGRSAPFSHRLAKALAVAMQIADDGAIAFAHRRMQRAVCSTTTAIWIHGELPERERLDAWLKSDCPEQAPQAWIDQVIARPRQALDGLALTLVGTGPAGATMLELVPWAPFGLVAPIAKPRRSAAPLPPMEYEVLGEYFLDEGKPAP